jgi:hypothetical protein
MSNEHETKKLLQFRDSMQKRKFELELEIKKIDTAIEEIDKIILNTGFRTFSSTSNIPNREQSKPENQSEEKLDELSIRSKDGTILGNMRIEDHTIFFRPIESFNFTLDIPPFQSFLIERVLDNMRKTDQQRASDGELDPTEILDYAIKDLNGRLTSLTITNYGGERRLREINSSLRWTLDKMYDKFTKG